MSSLSNQQINSSFNGVLQVPGGITSTLQTVQDGNGNPTGLQISSTAISGATATNFVPSIAGVQIANSVQRLINDGFGDYVSVKDFGAKGDGSTDDTTAFQNALTSSKSVFVPAGTYIVNGGLVIQDNGRLFGCGNASIIKRKNSSTLGAIIQPGSFSQVSSIYIDGNKAAQTVTAYGISCYQVQGVYISNVRVQNAYGIGVGFSNCAECVCFKVTVDSCGANGQGFWNDTYSTSSFYADGKHKYLFCTSTNNQLDGLSIATPGNSVIGGNYSYNGYGGTYGGALGAAGIFTLDGEVTNNLFITNAVCNNNTEYGINAETKGSTIFGNICNTNQLSGILLKGPSQRVVIDSNICAYNGWYTGSSNPSIWQRAGILISAGSSFSTISNNQCYDDRSAGSQTQEYGLRYNNADGSGTSSSLYFLGNSCRYNKTDDDNINPAKYTSNTNLTNVIYKNFVDGDSHRVVVAANNPNVSTDVHTLQLTGTFTLTNIVGGSAFQSITIILASGTVSVTNLAGSTGQIRLAGGTNASLANVGSSITFMYLNNIWYETARTIF